MGQLDLHLFGGKEPQPPAETWEVTCLLGWLGADRSNCQVQLICVIEIEQDFTQLFSIIPANQTCMTYLIGLGAQG